MKGDLTLAILEKVSEVACVSIDMMATIITTRYGASMKELDRNYNSIKEKRERFFNEMAEIREAKKKYRSMLYKLKRDGLISEKNKNGKKFIKITVNGLRKLERLRKNREEFIPANYKKEIGNRYIIVIFDIPEVQRKRRAWIRSVLKNLGLKMAQKSVWVGKAKIPKDFIDDLFEWELDEFVEIFEITKSGNLKHII